MDCDNFFDYKNQLMKDLLANQKIITLLNNDCVMEQDPKALIYKQIFPYEYVPDTVEQGKTFICCDVDVQKSINKTFMQPVLYIWEFTHKSWLRLPDGGVRTDRLANEIAKTINGSRYYGLGELDLYSIKRFAPIQDYQGKVLTFQMQEFNRPHSMGKQVPANRKKG